MDLALSILDSEHGVVDLLSMMGLDALVFDRTEFGFKIYIYRLYLVSSSRQGNFSQDLHQC